MERVIFYIPNKPEAGTMVRKIGDDRSEAIVAHMERFALRAGVPEHKVQAYSLDLDLKCRLG
jgi:hypothetical protein